MLAHFLHPNIPFGGVNHSGIGKSHGYQSFVAFSNEKSILKQKTGFTALTPLNPPYTKKVRRLVHSLLKYF